ncbi:MAG TPA: ATP-binding cassette domain-containing protein, partial [Candidatus Methylomirabilis sp.]|nr:ATP-binding cassette domain-containing protein [Candidatus Methylomirabilis sp.]
MAEVAIRVEKLGKQYRIGAGRPGYRTFREALVDGLIAPIKRLRSLSVSGEDRMIWAVRDVSFEVKHGEVLGIIGRNGAGKTTLLKILSRITKPTEGTAEIHGRVGSLL